MSWLLKAARVFWEILREVFDEAAYERFLLRSEMKSSTQAYGVFRREMDEAKARRPKCC
jgi:hypothetical protein